MMHSTTFKIVGAILVGLALLGFLFSGTFRSVPAVDPAPPVQTK